MGARDAWDARMDGLGSDREGGLGETAQPARATRLGLRAALAALALALLLALPLGGCSERIASSPYISGSSSGTGAPAARATEGSPEAERLAAQAAEGPSFTEDELASARADPGYEEYAPLDELGRCGTATAVVGPETMPEEGEERESIGMVKPSGWQTARYDDLVEGRYLYNRCHLIGWQLTAENANEENLVTGTRWMNAEEMLPVEDAVADYVRGTGNHVLYRATPAFAADELVCRGVLLEAVSLEDGGDAISIASWCPNVQPGIEIDYATGDSAVAADEGARAQGAEPAGETGGGAAGGAEASEATERAYVLNENTRRFHDPSCPSAEDIAPRNRRDVTADRDELIARGYRPCGRCRP